MHQLHGTVHYARELRAQGPAAVVDTQMEVVVVAVVVGVAMWSKAVKVLKWL